MPSRPAKTRAIALRAPEVPRRLDEPPTEINSRDNVSYVRADDSVVVAGMVDGLTLTESSWAGTDFSGRRITGLRVVDVEFVRCDFSGAILDGADLARVRFSSCRLTGVVLSASRLVDVLIEDCAANLANFRLARADRIRIDRTSLRDADFLDAHLTHAAILDSDLSQANFTRANTPQLELFGSTVEDLRGADSLRGAKIDVGQLIPMGAALVSAAGISVTDRTR